MQQLADDLGVAAGSLYHYFGGKEQLLIEICDQLTEPLLARARELVLGDDAPEEQLRALVRMWIANVIEYRDHMLVFQQVRHQVESGAQWRGVRDSRKAFERLVQGALERAHVTGVTGVDPRLSLVALLGMVNHTAQWYRPRGRLNPDQIADGYLELLTAERSAARA
jgi:AcrR family transcriptional regulator